MIERIDNKIKNDEKDVPKDLLKIIETKLSLSKSSIYCFTDLKKSEEYIDFTLDLTEELDNEMLYAQTLLQSEADGRYSMYYWNIITTKLISGFRVYVKLPNDEELLVRKKTFGIYHFALLYRRETDKEWFCENLSQSHRNLERIIPRFTKAIGLDAKCVIHTLFYRPICRRGNQILLNTEVDLKELGDET